MTTINLLDRNNVDAFGSPLRPNLEAGLNGGAHTETEGTVPDGSPPGAQHPVTVGGVGDDGDVHRMHTNDAGDVYTVSGPQADVGPWLVTRTLVAQVAEPGAPATTVVTGATDLTGYVYPGGFDNTSITVNGVTLTFAPGDPVSEAAMVLALNTAFPDVLFDIDLVGGRFLRLTYAGNLVLAGSLLAVAGIVAGTYGVWTDLGEPAPVLEITYASLVVAGAPDSIILRAWRQVGAVVDCIGMITLDPAALATSPSHRFSCDAQYVTVTVDFVGGAVPTLSGFILTRLVYAGAESGTAVVSADVAAGGSVGGGNNIWSNPQDFSATADVGFKTITFGGIAPVLAAVIDTINFSASVIKRVNTITGVVDTLPTTNVAYAAGVLTLADMAANFVAGDTVLVFVPGPDKAYDQAVDAQRSGGLTADDAATVGNPLLMGARYVADIFASVVSLTGNMAGLVTDQFRRLHVRPAGYDPIGDGIRALLANSLAEPQPIDMSQTVGGVDGTYDYFIDLDDYKYWTLQWNVTGGTADKVLTVWATDQDDGTAPASCYYTNVTLSWFGAAFFSVAGGALGGPPALEIDTPATWRYVRVRIVVGGVTPGAGATWLGYGRKQRM